MSLAQFSGVVAIAVLFAVAWLVQTVRLAEMRRMCREALDLADSWRDFYRSERSRREAGQ